MGKLTKIFTVIRTNWKKSILAAGGVIYGIEYGVDQYKVGCLMRAYCEAAVKYGDAPVGKDHRLRRITVILNPAANKKKAKKQFENYCAPLLYLSGVYVSIMETEKEGHARNLVDKIDSRTDALVIAGGDGTLSEAITGLMRSRGELCQIPIGVLPLGQRNSLASTLFGTDDSNKVNQIATATMAIIKGNTKPIDIFRIEPLNKPLEDNSSNPKPVYGVGSLEWGIRRELRRQAENLWYLGPLGQLATLIFHGSSIHTGSSLGFIEAKLRFSPPCSGCNKCYKSRADLYIEKEQVVSTSKWWNFSSLKNRRLQQSRDNAKDYSLIENESCETVEEKHIKTSDLYLTTSVATSEGVPKIKLEIGPKINYQGQLLADGFKILKEEKSVVVDKVEAKQVEIMPVVNNRSHEESKTEDCLAIDNEDYEVRPIKVTILPNSVKVFCK